MGDEAYKRLREFLDKLPSGFPEAPDGMAIKLLKKMFTPEQAELTVQLKEDPEDISAISTRINMDEAELTEKLEAMAKRGLIFRTWANDKRHYQVIQFFIGFNEFQINHLNEETVDLLENYAGHAAVGIGNIKTNQARIIPVESAVGVTEVASYNRVRELVRNQEFICVHECMCRKREEIKGNKCRHSHETCLWFGKFARFFIDNGEGRQISPDETLEILDYAEDAGLVLTSMNAQKLEMICCCCSCCCPSLKILKMVPSTDFMIDSFYEARIDPDLCTACGECIDRCQVGAITEGDEVSKITAEKCIGCGLCVDSCSTEAILMNKKAEMGVPPEDFLTDTGQLIRSERETIRQKNSTKHGL